MMTLGEGIALGTACLTLSGIVFALGKAWHRLCGHSEAIKTVRTNCAEWTQHCSERQETKFEEIRKSIDGVKDATNAVGTEVAGVKKDVQWLVSYVQKNGGPHA